MDFPKAVFFSSNPRLAVRDLDLGTIQKDTFQLYSPLLGDTASFLGRRPLYFADFFLEIFGRVERPAGEPRLDGCYVENRSFNPEGLSTLNIPIGFEAVN